MGLYKYKDQHNKYYQKKVFLHIFKEIINSLCALKFSDFKYDSKFFAIWLVFQEILTNIYLGLGYF